MTTTRDGVAANIVKAKADLEKALTDLEYLPTLDSGATAFAAHALNNFLSVISGTVELLLHSLRDHPDPKVLSRLEGLHHAANLMAHTVSQLMSTSAPAKPQLKHEKVDLPFLVQRACDYYQSVANRKGIQIVFTTTEVPPAWADRVAAAAVLDNLLSNAVKYSPLGKHIFVDVKGESAQVTCSIRDEGPGLGPQDHVKLFQRGVRLSAVPTAGEPSTGYGLAVAKELIDNLDGKIWCHSNPGQGACFCFSLPVQGLHVGK